MQFSERLAEYMKENNLRQVDIVNITKVSKGFLSNILNKRREPSKELLEALSKYSGHSINWWLHGVEEYNNLYSLNELIDFFIKNGAIKDDGTMDKETKDMLVTMLEKEIRVKLEQKKAQG